MSPTLWQAPFSPTRWPGSTTVGRRCVRCCCFHRALSSPPAGISTGTGTKSSSLDPNESWVQPLTQFHYSACIRWAGSSTGGWIFEASHRSSNQTVRPCSLPLWPQRSAINATRPNPRPSSEVASSARGAGVVDDPLSVTAMRSHDRLCWTMTSNSPPLPDAVCSKALVASSDTHKIASSVTEQPVSARATNRRAWATCSWRPGNTRRFARPTAAVSSHAVAVALWGVSASSLTVAR